MKAHAVLHLCIWSNSLKQREKCIQAATALIEEGTSVVIGTCSGSPINPCRST
jgi:hypothetical protein